MMHYSSSHSLGLKEGGTPQPCWLSRKLMSTESGGGGKKFSSLYKNNWIEMLLVFKQREIISEWKILLHTLSYICSFITFVELLHVVSLTQLQDKCFITSSKELFIRQKLQNRLLWTVVKGVMHDPRKNPSKFGCSQLRWPVEECAQ